MKEEEEATLHKPEDLETWWLRIMKAFADLLEPPTEVHTALKRDVRIGTNPTVSRVTASRMECQIRMA
jgi:hypothetical protein